MNVVLQSLAPSRESEVCIGNRTPLTACPFHYNQLGKRLLYLSSPVCQRAIPLEKRKRPQVFWGIIVRTPMNHRIGLPEALLLLVVVVLAAVFVLVISYGDAIPCVPASNKC
jgi:hypothetical protein